MQRWMGERLIEGSASPPRSIPLDAGGLLVLYSERAPHKEAGNEDSAAWLSFEDRLVLAVADGLGGAPSGARASALAVQAICEAVEAADDPTALRPAILDGFERANQRVLDLRVGAGTTLVVVEIGSEGLRTYHAGDSGALLVGQRGRLKLETMAHSPVGYRVAAGAVHPDETHLEHDRNLLSNCVGSPDLRVEMSSPVVLARRDTLLLASDGVLDNIRRDELLDCIRIGPVERVAAELAGRVRRAMEDEASDHTGNPDDATFFLHRPGAAP